MSNSESESFVDFRQNYKILDGVFTMEASDPYVFSLSTNIFMRLRTYCTQLLPKNRRIFITLKRYRIADIDPTYKQFENYTHVVIFCIKFLSNEQFQPIATVAIKRKSTATQTKILASLVCFFIDKLSKFNFHVYGTVSPATETFRSIFNYLAEDKNQSPLTYNVKGAGKMIHIYSIPELLSEFRNIMQEKDVRFRIGNEKSYLYSTYEEVHKVFDGIFSDIDEFNKDDNNLIKKKYGTPFLIDTINIVDFIFKMENIDIFQHVDLIYSWDFLIKTIESVQVRKRDKHACTNLAKPDENKMILHDDDQIEVYSDDGFDLVINDTQQFFNEFFHLQDGLDTEQILKSFRNLKLRHAKTEDEPEEEEETDSDEWNKCTEEKRTVSDLALSLNGARDFLLDINGSLNCVQNTIFCVDHIDYFLHILKKYKGDFSKIDEFSEEDTVWGNTNYLIFDKLVASLVFENEKGGAAYMAC